MGVSDDRGVAIVLFTADLRVHDNPTLVAAAEAARRVLPLFVVDDRALRAHGSANRAHLLVDALIDLRGQLRDRGADLVVRRGDTVEEVARLATLSGATRLFTSPDVSAFARRRLERLRSIEARLVEGADSSIVAAGEVRPSGGDHYRVFSAYQRRWDPHPRRHVVPAPRFLHPVDGVRAGDLPRPESLVAGAPGPDLERGGEHAARRRMRTWLDRAHEPDDREDLGLDATTRLSSALHLGTLSATELASHLDETRAEHAHVLRQLCWRDFNRQLLAANPSMTHQELRPGDWRWIDDPESFDAWRDGRTGYPVVDAAMRRLLRDGWMHNRARMVVASFLTKHLGIDWRLGARHFMQHLVDGDVANNHAGWQWAAGTGTDSRPRRMFNPVTQSRRHDPQARMIRREIAELSHAHDVDLHEPWTAGIQRLHELGYPPPIVDHAEARARFLERSGH